MIKAIFNALFRKNRTLTFHEYIQIEKVKIDNIRACIRPVIQECMQVFAMDKEAIHNVMVRLYRYSDHKLDLRFRIVSDRSKNCNVTSNYGYEFCDYKLYFYLHERFRLNDYDYDPVFVNELDAAIRPFGIMVKEMGIVPMDEKDIKLAKYCCATIDR